MAQAQSGPLPHLLGVSLSAYALLMLAPIGGEVTALCGQVDLQALWGLLTVMPWAWGLAPLAADWALMVVAMMTPLVSLQIARLIWSSRRALAPVAVGTFLAAYWLTWCTAALVLVPLAVAVTATLGANLAGWALVVAAVAYSGSPLAGRARNLCHRTDPIPAFGPGVVTGSAHAGLRIGSACCAACWPWMLVPIAVQQGHTLVMMLVGIYLFFERIAPPAQPTWRLPPGLESIFGPVRLGPRRCTTLEASNFQVR
ncbi:MAG: DUF2182 domain-containing protein [Pseudomonadota bacterium]